MGEYLVCSYRRGCRCDECTAKHRERLRAYYQSKGGNPNRKPEVERAYIARVGTAWQRYPETCKDASRRRRARKSGADAERFTSVEVFERDSWMCGICLTEVNPDAKYPDPASASLDHVVPLSLGGEHTRANTRLAHLTCNVKRGNRPARTA